MARENLRLYEKTFIFIVFASFIPSGLSQVRGFTNTDYKKYRQGDLNSARLFSSNSNVNTRSSQSQSSFAQDQRQNPGVSLGYGNSRVQDQRGDPNYDYQTRPLSTQYSRDEDDDGAIVFGDRVGIPQSIKRRPPPTVSRVGISENSNVKETSDSTSLFALNMLKQLNRETSKNIVVSPLSVGTLLALLQQGASGRSLDQLQRALGFSKEDSKQQYDKILKTLKKSASSQNDLTMANALFVSKEFSLNPNFKESAVRDFKASVDQLDFRNPSRAAAFINHWVDTNTRGKIPSIIRPESIDPTSTCVMTNAVHFKGVWKTTFNPQRTSSMEFQSQAGRGVNVPFMHQSGRFPAGEDERMGAKWLELPFDGSELSMVIVLPVEQHGLDQLVNGLKPSDLDTILHTRNHIKVTMSIPKFNITFETSLVNTLVNMGIQDIFSAQSGLTDISSNPSRPLLVGQAVHAAGMAIDERGSTAAAASVLAVNTLSLASVLDEFYFTANQPFLAIIVDKANSVPVFMAKVVDPSRS